jgi:predicted Co/Zn/Cd cation transporter (cation efflux family)
MTTLAFLMGRLEDTREPLFDPRDLFIAVFVSAVIALVWLLVAVLMKKKGKPLKLPSSFWYIAGPGALAIVIFIGICCFAIISSSFHKR